MSTSSSNPALRRFGSNHRNVTGVSLTFDDVIRTTVICLAVALGAGAVGWMFPLAGLFSIVGFVLALVIIFQHRVRPWLVLAYSAAQGLALGSVSGVLEARFDGIVLQAVLATVSVFGVSLVLYRKRIIRPTLKLYVFVTVAMTGYLVFSLLNLVLSLTGVIDTAWGVRGIEVLGIPLGGVIGVLAVVLAAICFIVDFGTVEYEIEEGAGKHESWSLAFGLMMTLIWLYAELLRLIAILRD